MKPKNAIYLPKHFILVVTTTFVGPDGFNRSFSVTGIPDEKTAHDFLKYMGWEDIPFKVME